MFLIIIGLVTALGAGVFVFTKIAPQFGQPPKGEHLEQIKKSPNYGDEGFLNPINTEMASGWDLLKTIPKFLFAKNGSPNDSIPVRFEKPETPVDSLCYVTWYGHSAFLFEMQGKRILIDPMLGETAAPVSFGSSRFPYEQPIPIDELTNIDAVILSHDHYDHLDYGTIRKLNSEVVHFYTALGVGSHLQFWGIAREKISELDWWDTADLDGLKLVAAPARHFSGRGITDRNATQWCSWVIKGEHHNLYFSGDGGYGPHFDEIGEKYGPFDLAMMECGQYNQAWKDIHMMPEKSVKAGLEVGGKLLMPIHWGAFNLAIHEWTEPIRRFKSASEELDAPMVHPYIGERFSLGEEFPREEWWEAIR